MDRLRFESTRTTYRGVNISLLVDPIKDWESVLEKLDKTADKICAARNPRMSRVAMVNMYMIPIMGYVGRFKLMCQNIATQAWKTIRRALGARSKVSTGILTSTKPPFKCQGKM
jgi:hypothetical protein